AISATLAPPQRVGLDLTALKFLSAAGLRPLLGLFSRCAGRGVRVHVVTDSAGVAHRVLCLARVSERALMFRAVAGAIAGGDHDPSRRSSYPDVARSRAEPNR